MKSDQPYYLLFDQNPYAVCSLDLEGNITSMNNQLPLLLECPETKLNGESIFPFLLQDEMGTVFRIFNLVKSGTTQKFKCKVQTVRNKQLTCIITYIPIKIEGAITGIYALINDITENVAEELELEKSLRDLKKILDASLDILCVLNIKGEFVRINKQVEELWGYEDWELVGKDIIDFVLEDDRRKTFEAFSQIKRGIELKDFENRMLKKDGSTIIMQWFASWDSMTHSVYASARHLKF
ncbi:MULTISPECIES: PAS domain-containing protein [Sediminibacterium]|uniref:PAS domain-containing protein n=1 Tax=Sediminibacterium TaxID=504481 RepID=UPI000478D2E2|nr:MULTISPECIES: PAS domain-containing protein [Sediminibacterium]